MDAQRLTESLTPFLSEPLSARATAQLLDYLALLLKWNAKMNLTAVRTPEEMVTRHFGESLFAAQSLSNAPLADAADVGSGAGFPGLPLAIYAPRCRVTLIESHSKKATFLREVIRTLEMRNVVVENARAESLELKASLVTMRAVEKFEQSARVAASLVAPGGRFAMLIGAAQVDAARKLVPEIAFADPVPVPLSESRVLLVGKSTAEER